MVCQSEASLKLVSFMVESWPDAVREKGTEGNTALHFACSSRAPLDVVSFLLNRWPGAIGEKTSDEYTPLHFACQSRAQWEVVAILLEKLPEVVTEKTNIGETPFDLADIHNAPEDTQMLVSYVSDLFGDRMNDPYFLEDMVAFCKKIGWSNGVALAFDKHAVVTQTIMNIHINTMPDLFSMIGGCCKMKAMWGVLCERQDLFKDIQLIR